MNYKLVKLGLHRVDLGLLSLNSILSTHFVNLSTKTVIILLGIEIFNSNRYLVSYLVEGKK